MTSESPSLSIDGAVATIALRRPAQANRLTPDDLGVLAKHIATVNAASDVLVLRFVASGKYFCSGYDISSLAAGDTERGSLYFGDTIELIDRARPVTIAAINGGIYGGATDLCLACDFRIGVETADMFMPAARLGLHIYPGAMQRYVSRLGLNAAKRLFLTAEKIDARTMYELGVLTQLVASEQLETATQKLTETLSAMAPIALLGMKRSLSEIARGEFDLARARTEVIRSEQSSDIQEGALAWKEKRTPRFTGH